MSEPTDLTALQARDLIARGELSPVDLVEACLARIEAREPEVGAWAFLDPEAARRQAKLADMERRAGRPVGPLHGVPVGVKDIIATKDMPTQNGTPIDAGRRTRLDANVVARLRAAGAIVLGKTVTTELAWFTPGKTRNPHDPGRTPGGSSSGSAAAVAAGMVPLAVGTQTAGSVIRPASFCGIVGFKPSFGTIGRSGILTQSPQLDTVGVFARTVADAALIGDVLAGYDQQDRTMEPAAAPQLLQLATAAPPAPPTLAFVRQPAWDEAEPTTQEAFAELIAALGGRCQEADLPGTFQASALAHRTILRVELAHHLRRYYDGHRDRLSPGIVEAIEDGREIKAKDYVTARELREALYDWIERLFHHYDSIVTPAAPGEAPGLESTGSPAFNAMWTFLGMPAVTLPLMQGPSGLPLGVQLVGRRGNDGRLLRTASWLADQVAADIQAEAAAAT